MLFKDLSGVILNQNAVPEGDTSYVPLGTSYFYQTFRLPPNYARGGSTPPPFTGFQVCVQVDEGYAHTAALDWKLEHYAEMTGWTTLAEDTTIGTAHDGEKVWMGIYLDEPVAVAMDWLTDQFRIAIKGRSGVGGTLNEPVEYDGTFVTIEGTSLRVVPDIASGPLAEGSTYPFTFMGIPSLLYVEPGSEQVYYSVQQGVTRVWYTAPNPLSTSPGSKAFTSDATTPVQDQAREVSFLFRVLAASADEGTDFLGNPYRSAVVTNKAEFMSTLDAVNKDRFWMSKPNPSRFAVENLYFDVRDSKGQAVVVDRLLLDPVTPGVWFNVYYSNTPAPGTDEASWDNLMWTPVNREFQANKRETHTLPQPITAKYLKIEFSHLQARFYSPGEFQRPVIYKKHPKWVLDYFLAQYASAFENPFVAQRVRVVYDALDLAYTYYADDLLASPDNPDAVIAIHDADQKLAELLNEENAALGVDAQTLAKIRIAFQPFLSSPALQGRTDTLIGSYLRETGDADYSTEVITRAVANTSVVSSDNRDSLVIEKSFPVMSFFIPCRHGYRVSAATFRQDRAYFVGVKEIAFTREHYATEFDHDLYIERVGDNVNTERNDFVLVNQNLVTYADS